MSTPPPPQPPQDDPRNGGYGYPSAGGPGAPGAGGPGSPYGFPPADGAGSPYGPPPGGAYGYPQDVPPQQPPYGAPGPNPYGGAPGPYGGPPYGMPQQQFSTTAALWAHLGVLLALTVGGFVTCGISVLLAWIVPLVIRSNARDPFTRAHATTALNLALTQLIYGAVLFVLSLVPFLNILFWVLGIGYMIAAIVFMIIAAVAASKGQPYRYPGFFAFPMAS